MTSHESRNTEIKLKINKRGNFPNLIVPANPITTSINKKWIDLMQEHSIGFNQYVHELVKGASYGGTIVNFDDKIERFFRMYTANRAVFTIYIRCKTTSDLTNPRRVSERGLASNSIGNQEPPPEALTMPMPSAPRFFQIQDAGTPQVIGNPRNVPRDEDTRAGNIIAQGEQDIRQRVVAQFSRISNRDMLTIWGELHHVRDSGGFNALNRMIPFTSGILRNIFVDELRDLDLQ